MRSKSFYLNCGLIVIFCFRQAGLTDREREDFGRCCHRELGSGWLGCCRGGPISCLQQEKGEKGQEEELPADSTHH